MSLEDNDILLLVEDNSNDVMLLRRALSKVGSTTEMHVVRDGDEALAYLRGEGRYSDRPLHPLPGLILLDLKLPKKSGQEVLEWLSKQPGLNSIPVVVLSTSQQVADVNAAYECGANSYLVKPVLFDELVETVRAFDHYWFRLNQRPRIA